MLKTNNVIVVLHDEYIFQMVLVADFARGVSVPRPLPAPPTPCASWVNIVVSLGASLILSLAWVSGFIWLFMRYL